MKNTGYGLCECGCGERTKLAPRNNAHKGWVKGVPYRFVKGHACRSKGPRYIEKDCGYKTACWVWQLALDAGGYGVVTVDCRWMYAHRAAYEEVFGDIPEGLHLDHLCRVRRCVNPEHMEPVTLSENSRRGANAKLSKEIAQEIRLSNLPDEQLAARYRVTKKTIARVRTGETWA